MLYQFIFSWFIVFFQEYIQEQSISYKMVIKGHMIDEPKPKAYYESCS